MVGVVDEVLVIVVVCVGGLGVLFCVMFDVDILCMQVVCFCVVVVVLLNFNFFCYVELVFDVVCDVCWCEWFVLYYDVLGLLCDIQVSVVQWCLFDVDVCVVVEVLCLVVVSFYFGLFVLVLVDWVKVCGVCVLGSVIMVVEVCWLDGYGCDVIIVQGWEVGGYCGLFLDVDVMIQLGLFVLLLQVVDVVDVLVIVVGGIGDVCGIYVVFVLGVVGVQLGIVFLFSDEVCMCLVYCVVLQLLWVVQMVVINLFFGWFVCGIVN